MRLSGAKVSAYIGIMSAVLVGSIPVLETVRALIVLYGLLPVAALGVVAIITGNVFYPRR